MRAGNISAAIASRQTAIRNVQAQIDSGKFSPNSLDVLRNLKTAHETALAKLLEAAPEKVTNQGEAE